MRILPSIGGAAYSPNSLKCIRLILQGCRNRPFFLISVMEKKKEPYEHTIEQLGSFDPMPNSNNEKLVAINFRRLEHWIREGALVTDPVLKLLGLAGYFPIHPKTYMDAWNNRKKLMSSLEELKIAANSILESKKKEKSTDSSSSPSSESTESTEKET